MRTLILVTFFLLLSSNKYGGIPIVDPLINILKGDPFNLSGGAKEMGDQLDESIKKLDATLSKQLDSLAKINQEFHKNNLILIDKFQEGNMKLLDKFNQNNNEIVSDLNSISIDFNSTFSKLLAENIKLLSSEATIQRKALNQEVFPNLNKSFLFLGLILYLIAILIASYVFFLFKNERKNIRSILLNKPFLFMSAIGILFYSAFLGYITYTGKQRINDIIKDYEINYYNGRLNSAIINARVLTDNGRLKENPNFLFLLEKAELTQNLLLKPYYISTETVDLTLKNETFLRLHKKKLDPDILTLQAFTNWTYATNKLDRIFASVCAQKALITKDTFGLKNLAIDIISMNNLISANFRNFMFDRIDNIETYEELFGENLFAIYFNWHNKGKELLPLYGMSPQEARIRYYLVSVDAAIKYEYIELLGTLNRFGFKRKRIKHCKAIIKLYDELLTELGELSKSEMAYLVQNKSIIKPIYLLKAYIHQNVDKQLSYEDFTNIPANKVKNTFTLGVNTTKTVFEIEHKDILLGHTKKVIANPDKVKAIQALKLFSVWNKNWENLTDKNLPYYIKRMINNNRTVAFFKQESILKDFEPLYLKYNKDPTQITESEYYTLLQICNKFGFHDLFDSVIQNTYTFFQYETGEIFEQMDQKTDLLKLLALEI